MANFLCLLDHEKERGRQGEIALKKPRPLGGLIFVYNIRVVYMQGTCVVYAGCVDSIQFNLRGGIHFPGFN